MTAQPALPRIVWSLDFELRWGMHDILGMHRDAYRQNLEGAREAVPRLLELFAQRNVRATWATVGALACADWDEYARRAPPPPRYADMRLAIDPRYADLDPTGVLHFAPDLVRLVAQAPGQDLGTHTFSHIFLGEPGVTLQDVAADHAAATGLFRDRLAATPTSLVFPRNQVGFLGFFRANGISAWRGNEASWFYRMTQHANRPLVRALRLADALMPWRTHGGRFDDGCTTSTAFVRVGLPEVAWRTHVAKIAAEARRLQPGGVLHFWLHPHNLGKNVPRGIARLAQVLDTLDRSAPTGTRYASMRDLAISAVQPHGAAV
jgi:peptidoglycan/xylan/chitin deacetylase (PgdA/CDA1 family)